MKNQTKGCTLKDAVNYNCLISGDKLFHRFITEGKKYVLNISVLHRNVENSAADVKRIFDLSPTVNGTI